MCSQTLELSELACPLCRL